MSMSDSLTWKLTFQRVNKYVDAVDIVNMNKIVTQKDKIV